MSIVTTEGISAGDFFTANVGYDQTLIVFYKVIKVTAQSVVMERWSKRTVGSEGHELLVVPGDEAEPVMDWRGTGFDAKRVPLPPRRYAVRQGKPGAQQYVSVSDYANAYPRKAGTVSRETHPAFGR